MGTYGLIVIVISMIFPMEFLIGLRDQTPRRKYGNLWSDCYSYLYGFPHPISDRVERPNPYNKIWEPMVGLL